jgi:hypothetical protein
MERFVITMNDEQGFAEAIKKMINKMTYSHRQEKAYEKRMLTVSNFDDEIQELPMLAAELICDGQFMDNKIDFDQLIILILKDCNPLQRKVLGKFLNDQTYRQIGVEVGKTDRRVSQILKDIVEIGKKIKK